MAQSRKGVVEWPRSLFVILLSLSVVGVGMIYSAGELSLPSPFTEGLWRRQAVFLLAGVVAFLTLSRLPSRLVQTLTYFMYIAGVAILAVTLVVGSGRGTAAGVKSFLSLGGFSFQPAELAKVTTALALAWMLAKGPEIQHLRDLIKPTALVSVPLALVVLQPDLGTAMAFIGIYFAALLWARTPLPIMLFAMSPGFAMLLAWDVRVWGAFAIVLFLGLYLYRFKLMMKESVSLILINVGAGAVAQPIWNMLAPYQRNRLLVFLNPEQDPQGAGWQLIQSKIAMGSGGLVGKGFTEGTQKRLNFLPEMHTDFIFSVVGEEFGFVGTSLVLVAFAYLFFRMIRLAEESRDHFAGLFIFGILGAWLTHVCVNVGMTVGVLPITGIPLPFISYGGSFLLMSWVAAGLAVSLSQNQS